MYLASASPRRYALLEQIGVPFQARPAQICEALRPGELPHAYVTRLARAKADTVWDEVAAGEARPVLGADTAVVIDDQVFGKPGDAEAALHMLADLSGRTHRVSRRGRTPWTAAVERAKFQRSSVSGDDQA